MEVNDENIYNYTYNMLLLFPLFGEGNLLYAQRMASEYDGGSLWKHADETGYYGIEHCDIGECKFIACGTSPTELENNMIAHKKDKHPYTSGLGLESPPEIDDSWNSNVDGSNNNSSDNHRMHYVKYQ